MQRLDCVGPLLYELGPCLAEIEVPAPGDALRRDDRQAFEVIIRRKVIWARGYVDTLLCSSESRSGARGTLSR
jgi:hypothetical protein